MPNRPCLLPGLLAAICCCDALRAELLLYISGPLHTSRPPSVVVCYSTLFYHTKRPRPSPLHLQIRSCNCARASHFNPCRHCSPYEWTRSTVRRTLRRNIAVQPFPVLAVLGQVPPPDTPTIDISIGASGLNTHYQTFWCAHVTVTEFLEPG